MQDPNNTTPDFTKPFDSWSITSHIKPVVSSEAVFVTPISELPKKPPLKPKRWLTYFYGAGALLFVYATIDSIQFMQTAKPAQGTVISVTGENHGCGNGSSKHDCTEFTAYIEFFATGWTSSGMIITQAGKADEYDQPITLAEFHVGEKVPVLYDPNDLTRAYQDDGISPFIWPVLVIIIFGIFRLVLAGLADSSNKK